MTSFGERSKLSLGSWTENFVLPCMPVFGCIGLSAVNLYNGDYTEDFKARLVILDISR